MLVAAADLAREHGVDPRRLRSALRAEGFVWHAHNDRWIVELGGEPHRQILAVLARLR